MTVPSTRLDFIHCPQIREIMNWGEAALRRARRDGLRIDYNGRQGYVLGSDVIDYIRSNSKSARWETS